MMQLAVVSFTTFFATIGPIDVVAMFAALTARADAPAGRSMALRGVAVAALILLAFALAGKPPLAVLGISLAALRVAGGILLLLIGIDMCSPALRAGHPPPTTRNAGWAAGCRGAAALGPLRRGHITRAMPAVIRYKLRLEPR